jgi:two-component system, NarL family, response regulator LiaR
MNVTNILLVDDHPMMREALRAALEAEPELRVVGEATDGDEAVRHALLLKPDVIVMDLYMPGKDGVSAIREIIGQDPHSRILVVTSSTEDEKVVAAVQAGAIGYLLKSAPRAEFIRGVKEVARGNAYMPPEVATKLAREMCRSTGETEASEQPVKPLTPREEEILSLLGEGLSNQAIAHTLSLSESTVRVHVYNILGKLGLEDRNQAIVYALRQGKADK